MIPRCVLVLDPTAPRWLIANASAVLGASIGARGDVELGPGLVDATGSHWAAIAEIVVPVLAAPAAELVELRAAAHTVGVTALAFPDLARVAGTYAEFAAAMAATPAAEVQIHGLALLGPDRLVRGLTRGLRPLGDPVTEAVR
jgi:hypothetical protein